MTKLFYQGDQEVDMNKRIAIGKKLLDAEAALQPVIYLAATNYHVTFNSRLGGEMPRNLWDAYYGSRNFIQTYIK